MVTFEVSGRGCTIRLPLFEEEQLYGFGLQMHSFRQNGRKKTIRTNADPRSDSGDSHAPVPFYVSTLGYGVFVDTARYASFYCGSSASKEAAPSDGSAASGGNTTEQLYQIKQSASVMVIDIPAAAGVDLYFFSGTNLKDVVRRYNLFSGGGCLPPLKGMGILFRGYTGAKQEDILEMARAMREDRMPCDILGLEPGWHSHSYSCSYTWNREN